MRTNGELICFPTLITCITSRNLPICTTSLDHLNGDKDGNQNIILEFVIDCSLWIWDAFFSPFRINNDVNVLNRSP